MSNLEDTQSQTQSTLEGFHIIAGLETSILQEKLGYVAGKWTDRLFRFCKIVGKQTDKRVFSHLHKPTCPLSFCL